MPDRVVPLVTDCIFQEESMSEVQRYDDAVRIIKTAILQSQYDAAKSANENIKKPSHFWEGVVCTGLEPVVALRLVD